MVATHLWYARSLCFRFHRPCSASSSPLLGGSTSSNATSSTIARKKTASFAGASAINWVNSTGRRNTSMMRCCDAETETETVRPGGSACDAFAWSAAGNGACGAATNHEATRARPVLAWVHGPSRRGLHGPPSRCAYQRSVARSCAARSGSAPGAPWRWPSSSPASRRRPAVSVTPRRSAWRDPPPDSTPR